MTLAIAHDEPRDDQHVAVLDAIREVRPPFSPDAVVEEFAELLRTYRIASVGASRPGDAWCDGASAADSGRVPGDGQSGGRGWDDARERPLTKRAREACQFRPAAAGQKADECWMAFAAVLASCKVYVWWGDEKVRGGRADRGRRARYPPGNDASRPAGDQGLFIRDPSLALLLNHALAEIVRSIESRSEASTPVPAEPVAASR